MAGAFLGIAFGDKIHWVHFGEVLFEARVRRERFSGMCLGAKIHGVHFEEVYFGLKVRWGRFSGMHFESRVGR